MIIEIGVKGIFDLIMACIIMLLTWVFGYFEKEILVFYGAICFITIMDGATGAWFSVKKLGEPYSPSKMLKGTGKRILMYLIAIMVIHVFESEFIKTDDLIVRGSIAILAANECYSVLDNLGKISGDPIFTKIKGHLQRYLTPKKDRTENKNENTSSE
jgi:phage-related holin